MKIACLSGKGGTGKTFVAVNLAAAAGHATYIDCDVEEPNGELFFQPKCVKEETVYSLLPEFDKERCNGCKKCVEFCRFHALVYIKEKPMVFSEVCHSCGGCKLVCPEGAVRETKKPIGVIRQGEAHGCSIVTGILNPGETSGVPVIREALKRAGELTIIDCPPGSACSVMESVMDVDYCVIVVEPTAFGFHNFQMVYELVTLLGRNCGIVINKEEEPYEPLEQFCREKQVTVLARIPFDAAVAAEVAKGQILVEHSEGVKEVFTGILRQIGGAR